MSVGERASMYSLFREITIYIIKYINSHFYFD